MVQAMIDLSEQANHVLKIVKAKHNLNDKSEAIDLVVKEYGRELLEPELRPEFVERMTKRQNKSTVKIKNFREHFGLK